MGELTDTLRGFPRRAPGRRPRHGRLPTDNPRQSVVYYVRDGNRLLISTESKRLKAQDVMRTGRASICIRGDEQPYPSATFSGPAEILTEEIGASTARIMQRIAGMDEPPEPQTDVALASIDRVILAITIEKVTAASYIPRRY